MKNKRTKLKFGLHASGDVIAIGNNVNCKITEDFYELKGTLR